MKGMAKSKAVTSGRLTGRVKMQLAQRRVIPNPGTAPCPEPAFSLYSTDSEDQVASLHTGLDRCAALLSGILQAEKAEAVKSPPRVLKSTSAKARPSNSLGKRTIKKTPTPTEQKSCRMVRLGPGSTSPRARHRSTVPAAHSGVKLHPPRHQAEILPQSLSHLQTPKSVSSPRPSPGPSPHPGPPSADAPNSKSGCDGEEEDIVPVRDTDAQSAAAHTLPAVRRTHSHAHLPAFTTPNTPPGSGQLGDAPEGAQSSAETDGRLKTGQYLLGQLKALITGQGSVAERLLSDLEQTVLLPLMNAGSSNLQTEPEESQDTQLSRCVRTLNQPSKEKTGRHQNHETLCHSEVLPLQQELAAAQLRLQELQDDLTELREALQDTQSQLQDREAQNALIKSELDAARGRLLDGERERRELASTAQQRLEEIGRLRGALRSRVGLPCASAAESSAPRAHSDRQHGRDPAELPTDRITRYLMSLGQPEATHTKHLHVAAEREGNTPELRDASSPSDAKCQPRDHRDTHLLQPHGAHQDQPRERPDNCDAESVWSEWSMRSGSTFDTRDEAAFQDGLSALDASIASLQKTIQLDLGR